MLASEAPPQENNVCARMGCQAEGVFSCSDCDHGGALHCTKCILRDHKAHPFHRPIYWDGQTFQRRNLAGLELIAGMHNGDSRCPHEHEDGGPQYLTIMDVNGIHEAHVGWCRCAGAPTHAEQLLRRQILPASTLRPQTGFTFRVMKLFQMLNLVGRLTPWDFCGALQRLTDNSAPESLKVRVRSSRKHSSFM
jgi:hypothetical protein